MKAGAKGIEVVGQKGRSETPVWNLEGAKEGMMGQALPVPGGPPIPRAGSGKGTILSQTNIKTLVSASEMEDVEQILDPPESVQEKVAFMFNNLSQANLNKKVNIL